MKRVTLVTALFFLLAEVALAGPSAMEIIRKVDENQNRQKQIITYAMTVHGKRTSRTIKGKSWIDGDEKSYTEYLAPVRERGTKMLKVGDKLWTYYPKADRVVSISGHMLRRSVMGSDLSYEDMMEKRGLEEIYKANLDGEEVLDGRKTYVITLEAIASDVAYQKLRVWVDQERFVTLKQEMYAASGKLLKRMETLGMERHKGRWYVNHMRFKDVLKEGKGTEFLLEEVDFDAEFSDRRFSKGQLRR